MRVCSPQIRIKEIHTDKNCDEDDGFQIHHCRQHHLAECMFKEFVFDQIERNDHLVGINVYDGCHVDDGS